MHVVTPITGLLDTSDRVDKFPSLVYGQKLTIKLPSPVSGDKNKEPEKVKKVAQDFFPDITTPETVRLVEDAPSFADRASPKAKKEWTDPLDNVDPALIKGILTEPEVHSKDTLAELEQVDIDQAAAKSLFEAQEFVFDKANQVKKGMKKGCKELPLFIPKHLVGDDAFLAITETLKKGHKGVKLIDDLFKVFESFFSGADLVQRFWFIRKAEQIIKHSEEAASTDNGSQIKKWKEKIRQKRDSAIKEAVKYAGEVSSNASTFVQLTPFKWISEFRVIGLLDHFGSGVNVVFKVYSIKKTWAIYKRCEKNLLDLQARVTKRTLYIQTELSPVQQVDYCQQIKVQLEESSLEGLSKKKRILHFRNFVQLLTKSNFSEIKLVLERKYHFTLPEEVNSKEDLVKLLDDQVTLETVFNAFWKYEEKLVLLNKLLKKSNNPLERRALQLERNFLILKAQYKMDDQLRDRILPVMISHFDEYLKQEVEYYQTAQLTFDQMKLNLKDKGINLPEHVERADQVIEYLISLYSLPLETKQDDLSEYHLRLVGWSFNFDNIEFTLKAYIDRQETLANTIKNALQDILKRKYQIDKEFIQLQIGDKASSLVFKFLTAALFLGALAIATTPVGQIKTILLFLEAGITAILAIINLYKNYKYKKDATFSLSAPHLNTVLIYKNVQLNFQKRALRLSQQEVDKRKANLAFYRFVKTENRPDLNKKELRKLLRNSKELLKKAKENLKLQKSKVADLSKEMEHIEKTLLDKRLKDAAHSLSLTPAMKNNEIENDPIKRKIKEFDFFKAFNQGFLNCDFSIIDTETIEFFEIHLGINLVQMQEDIHTDPTIIKNTINSVLLFQE